jgi:copper transport protein
LFGSAVGLVAAGVLAVQLVGWNLAELFGVPAGRLLAAEFGSFLASVVLSWVCRPTTVIAIRMVAAAPLVSVLIAEGLRAHPHAASPWLGLAITVLHLAAAAVWTGVLVHVLRTALRWRRDRGWGRLLGHDYARLALALLLTLLATGTVAAILLLPSVVALVDTTYGIVLLVKLGVVAAVIALAVAGRRRLRRTTSGPLFGRATHAEIAGLVGVLAVTAVLVSVAPPGPTTTALAAPPAPSGPVAPAGTLAGQVTVLAAASTGQLIVHLVTPASDTGGAQPAYQVTGQLTLAGSTSTPLALRECGTGCLTAVVAWKSGDNQVALVVAAPPWDGGTARLDIPWPPRTDPTVLPAVLAAMTAAPSVIVHEAVTSDYTGNPGVEQPVSLSGAQFIATEPYATGGGDPVVLARFGENNQDTELGLSFPDGRVVRMIVGPDHRILREDYTTPNHLITRAFDYPTSG